MSKATQDSWLPHVYDAAMAALAVVLAYAVIVWLFGIVETHTKLWLLATLVSIAVLDWLVKRFRVWTYLLSLKAGRNLGPLMRKGFGREAADN